MTAASNEPLTFPIFPLRTSLAQRPEALGSKEKYWLSLDKQPDFPEGPYLFKIGRPNTGENWSEKIAYELGTLAGLPCARYELAESEDCTRGVLSRSFLNRSDTLIPGNMLLATFTPGYDGSRTFKQVQYSLGNVLRLLRRIRGLQPPRALAAEIGFSRGVDVFVGYLVFDAWIGNTDRHHENWGVVVTRQQEETEFSTWLAPSFDHASCLGRELSDERRSVLLSTRDTRANVQAYASRARSAFFSDETEPVALVMRDVLRQLMRSYPEATKLWADRICAISPEQIQRVCSLMNRDWISEEAVEFARRLLSINADMIREVCHGR